MQPAGLSGGPSPMKRSKAVTSSDIGLAWASSCGGSSSLAVGGEGRGRRLVSASFRKDNAFDGRPDIHTHTCIYIHELIEIESDYFESKQWACVFVLL